MTTKYPGAIDGYQEIRAVSDRNDEIIAQDHNDLRSAVLAVENTLGIDPQGAYGTVVARLQGGDSIYTAHVRGTADRHRDSYIDGYEKVGAYFNLPAGTVAEQFTSLLTEPLPMDKALDAFVLEGCAVTQGSGVNANVSEGWVSSNGSVKKVSAQTVTVPTAAGTYYVYALNSNSSSTLGCALASGVPFDPDNPLVLLHKIVHNGSTWTSASSYDIRRYGAFVNNKSHFTVGDAPSSGNDGYGCDFTSLDAAFEHIKALEAAASDEMLISKKVVLVSDVVVPSYSSSYTLDGYGWEIDGAGRKLTISTDSPYLTITGNNIRIHDLTIESALTSTNDDAALAELGDCENLIVTDCHMTKSTALCFAEMFIVTGTPSGCIIANNNVEVKHGLVTSGDLTNSIVSNNRVFQKVLVNITNSSFDAIHVGDGSIVEGNYIYGNFYSGVRVSGTGSTMVRNNIIVYPYEYGIRGGSSTIGNIILGNTSLTLTAAIDASGTRSVIHNNYIADCNGVGIDANGISLSNISNNTLIGDNINSTHGIYSVGSLSVVSNNLLYKYGTSTTDIGIDMGTESVVNNNLFYYQGGIAIDVGNLANVTIDGNQIRGGGGNSHTAIKDTGNGCVISNNIIQSFGGASSNIIDVGVSSYNLISNNSIISCAGTAINCNSKFQVNVIGNLIDGYSESKTAIDNVGKYSSVSGNMIKDYGEVADGYCVYVTGDRVNVHGNHIFGVTSGDLLAAAIEVEASTLAHSINDNMIVLTQNTQIQLNDVFGCLVSGNYLKTNGTLGDLGYHAIAQVGQGSVVANNIIGNPHGNGIDITGSGAMCLNNSLADVQGVGITIGGGVQAAQVINNSVIESDGGSITIGASSPNQIIVGNTISEVASLTASIDCGNNSSIICNNTMQGSATDYAIYNFGPNSRISGNYTIMYTDGAIYTTAAAAHSLISDNIVAYPGVGSMTVGIEISSSSEGCIISNNVLGGEGATEELPQYGIELNGATEICCIGNVIYCADVSASSEVISSVGSWSVVSNNILHGANGHGIGVTASHVLVSNNMIVMDDAVGTYHGVTVSGSNVIVSGNRIFDSSGKGIYTNSSSYSCFITNNYISSTNDYGIHMLTMWHVCSGNFIESSSTAGIYMQGAESCLNGNLIRSSGTDGILLSGSKNSVIGNYFDSCAQYGINLSSSGAGFNFISGNYILDSEDGSIYITSGANNISIVGNYIYETDSIANGSIMCNGTEDTLISNNYMRGINTVEAIVDFGSNCTISNNTITRYLAGPTISGNAAESFAIIGNAIVDVSNTLTEAIKLTASYCGIIDSNLIGDYNARLYYKGIDFGGTGLVLCSNNFICCNDQDNSSSTLYYPGAQSTIVNNTLYGTNGHGIQIVSIGNSKQVVSGNIIIMSQANGTYNGIYVGSFDCVVSSNCVFNSSSHSIYLVAVGTENVISNNQICSSNTHGIYCDGKYNNINGNYIYDVDDDGIYLDGYSQCSFNYINAAGSNGIQLKDNITNSNVVGNYVYDSGNAAIYTGAGLHTCNINDNIIYDCSDGIYAINAAEKININIIGNNITNSDGINFQHHQRSNISNNSILNSSTYGINVNYGVWSNISGNNIARCNSGLSATNSDNICVNGNVISHATAMSLNLQTVTDSIFSNNLAGPGNTSSDTMVIGAVDGDDVLVIGNYMFAGSGKTGINYSASSYDLKLIGNVCKGGNSPNVSHWSTSWALASSDNIYQAS